MDLYLAYSEVLGFLKYLEDLGRAERVRGPLRERWRTAEPGDPGGQVYLLHSTDSRRV
jgi:hypothetical protein